MSRRVVAYEATMSCPALSLLMHRTKQIPPDLLVDVLADHQVHVVHVVYLNL